MNKNRYLMKNAILMFIGTFGTKFISFFMVPIYTHVLTTAEYGQTDIAFTISMLLSPVVALNIHESIMRFAMDKDADISGITTSGIVVFFIGMIVSAISIPIMSLFQELRPYAFLIYCTVWCTALLYIMQSYLKGTDQIKLYSGSGILLTFLTASLNIVFLVYFKMGVTGYLLSTVMAYILTILFCFLCGKVYRNVVWKNFERKKTWEMLKYSIALVPNSILWWLINSSNRLIISNFLGASANGIFAVSNKLPTLMNNITSVFQQAWQLTAIKGKDDSDSNQFANGVFSMYSGAIWCCAAGIIWLQKIVMHFYVEKRFFIAWRYTPLLVLAFAFLAMGSYIGTYYSVAKNSLGMMLSAVIGMVFNLGLNFLLIPRIGLQGASIAACAGYGMILLYRYFDTKKYVKIQIFNIKFLASLIIIFTQIMISLSEIKFDFIISTFCTAAIILINRNCIFLIMKTFKSRKKKGEIT